MKHKGKHCCEVTYWGVNEWYKEKFEKLGWMVLAKYRGYHDKIAEYKNSLARLKRALEHKLTHLRDKDKIDDLKIMHQNICILIDHVDKYFQ
jgi:hypothetical protein